MNLNDLLGQVLVAVLQLGGVACVGFVAALATQLYKTLDVKLGVDRTNLIKTWVASAVKAAEQSITDNPAKKAAAIKWVQNLADSHGIKVDVVTIEMLIESAVSQGIQNAPKPDAPVVTPGVG